MYGIRQRLVTLMACFVSTFFIAVRSFLLLSTNGIPLSTKTQCHCSFYLQLTFPHIACSRTLLHLHQFKIVVECIQRIYCSVDTFVIF